MATRSNFKAVSGKTNLTATGSGSFQFGVDSNIEINNSGDGTAAQNLAKVWLSDNLNISFDMSDDVSTSVVSIKELNKDYNVHPDTSQPGRVTINGEEYLRAGNGLRNAGFSVPNIGFTLTNNTTPSSSIIDTLNGATVRIHLGTMTYKYDNYFTEAITGNPKIASTEVYLNLNLAFIRPTCTMANQTVNLASVPISILNSQQTAGEQNFSINISCTTSMPSNMLLARVTDSYTPENSNSNGVLKNQPKLSNKSNVDVQLIDESNTPLVIGILRSFYNVPTGSTATTFIKALKARYFRSALRATAGYVRAQATVFLDYQ
ncbi:fimbrial protein [Acinetobacter guillouiae]|uniref:Fimbrial protein n=2 Tax=Acinetobacter guillouiae TaxID=106649 RepID=A0A8X8KC92_ACIGI|nr:fimbrial protein [Acinetobacter guillouiae]